MTRFRIRPFEVDAIQWTGRPYGFLVQRIQALAGDDMFDVIDEAQRPYMDDPEATAAYRDHDRGGTWQPVYNGDWIVRRLDTGKVFRLPDDVFRAAYEALPYTVDEAGVHIYGETP